MFGDWLIKCILLSEKNAELENICTIIGRYMEGKMRTITSAYTVEN